METLKLLLVGFQKNWHYGLAQALRTSDYTFEMHQVSTKKQALFACYQEKYDILITNYNLPDGSAEDLTQVLARTVACLVINESCPLTSSPDLPYTEKASSSLRSSDDWISTLNQVLAQWEKSLTHQLSMKAQNLRSLYTKVTLRCAQELYHTTENRVENALKIILDIMEVSRVYVREVTLHPKAPSRVVHELTMPGQLLYPGPFHSVCEVPIRRENAEISFLGVEDTLNQRVWEQTEMDLLKTVASLLRKNPEEIRRHVGMYQELGLTA